MKCRVLAAMIAAIVLASPVAAQVDRHRGRVVIGSAAADAVSIPNGGITTNRIDVANANPLIYSNETDGPANEKKWRFLGFAGDLYLQTESDDGLTVNTSLQITRTGAAVGQVLMPIGTASAPALAFTTETGTGLYLASAGVIGIASNGAASASIGAQRMSVDSGAFGTGFVTGGRINAGRNSSGATAPGVLVLQNKTGADTPIWADSTGVVRVGSAGTWPYESTGDTVGTVVGTQTSTRASKAIVGEVTSTAAAMAVIRATPVYQFTYKSGAYNGETFFGIVTDESPLFGMDAGKSFNPVTAFGATVLALRDLDARVSALEARQ